MSSAASQCSAIREHNDFESRLEPAIMNMVVYASCTWATRWQPVDKIVDAMLPW